MGGIEMFKIDEEIEQECVVFIFNVKKDFFVVVYFDMVKDKMVNQIGLYELWGVVMY